MLILKCLFVVPFAVTCLALPAAAQQQALSESKLRLELKNIDRNIEANSAKRRNMENVAGGFLRRLESLENEKNKNLKKLTTNFIEVGENTIKAALGKNRALNTLKTYISLGKFGNAAGRAYGLKARGDNNNRSVKEYNLFFDTIKNERRDLVAKRLSIENKIKTLKAVGSGGQGNSNRGYSSLSSDAPGNSSVAGRGSIGQSGYRSLTGDGDFRSNINSQPESVARSTPSYKRGLDAEPVYARPTGPDPLKQQPSQNRKTQTAFPEGRSPYSKRTELSIGERTANGRSLKENTMYFTKPKRGGLGESSDDVTRASGKGKASAASSGMQAWCEKTFGSCVRADLTCQPFLCGQKTGNVSVDGRANRSPDRRGSPSQPILYVKSSNIGYTNLRTPNGSFKYEGIHCLVNGKYIPKKQVNGNNCDKLKYIQDKSPRIRVGTRVKIIKELANENDMNMIVLVQVLDGPYAGKIGKINIATLELR